MIHLSAGKRGCRFVAALAGCARRNMSGRFACRSLAVVTRRAAARRSGMIESRAAERRGGLVTGFARCRRRHVVCTLAAGGTAVMTADAARRNSSVIELGRGEGHGVLVTGLAGLRRGDMARRLALGARSVVTAGAGSLGLLVVVFRLIPSGNRMTGLARVRRRQVIGGFSGCLRAVVTGGTAARRAFELAADVAGSAIARGVSAIEREAGCRVIKAARRCGICHRHEAEYDADDAGQEGTRAQCNVQLAPAECGGHGSPKFPDLPPVVATSGTYAFHRVSRSSHTGNFAFVSSPVAAPTPWPTGTSRSAPRRRPLITMTIL